VPSQKAAHDGCCWGSLLGVVARVNNSSGAAAGVQGRGGDGRGGGLC